MHIIYRFIIRSITNSLLLWGGLWSLVFAVTFKFELGHIILLILFGLIPLFSAYLIKKYALNNKDINQNSFIPNETKQRLSTSEKLHHIFYELLEQKNGYIDEINFAMHAKISGKKAHLFLQEKAREFNAKFIVTEDGDTAYKFQYITHSEINKIKNQESLNIEIGYAKTVLNKPDLKGKESI